MVTGEWWWWLASRKLLFFGKGGELPASALHSQGYLELRYVTAIISRLYIGLRLNLRG
jgi:hypothetical protein